MTGQPFRRAIDGTSSVSYRRVSVRHIGHTRTRVRVRPHDESPSRVRVHCLGLPGPRLPVGGAAVVMVGCSLPVRAEMVYQPHNDEPHRQYRLLRRPRTTHGPRHRRARRPVRRCVVRGVASRRSDRTEQIGAIPCPAIGVVWSTPEARHPISERPDCRLLEQRRGSI